MWIFPYIPKYAFWNIIYSCQAEDYIACYTLYRPKGYQLHRRFLILKITLQTFGENVWLLILIFNILNHKFLSNILSEPIILNNNVLWSISHNYICFLNYDTVIVLINIRACHILLEDEFPWKVLSRKWLTTWEYILIIWSLCQALIFMRTIPVS